MRIVPTVAVESSTEQRACASKIVVDELLKKKNVKSCCHLGVKDWEE